VRAVVYVGPGEVEVQDVPAPRLVDPTDVLVQVTSAGICGTDLHVSSGHAQGVTPGTVLGHEFVGVVSEVGAAVVGRAVGEKVMSSDFAVCGRCWWCRRGAHWHCPERRFFGTGTAFGAALPGGQADVVRVPFGDVTLAPVPAGVPEDAALLLGDNLATGWVACQRGGVRPGDVVAVVGAGPVGQLSSLAAQLHGAAVVVVSDPVPARRELAAAHGAVAVSPERAREAVDALTEGRGADVVVEAVGGSRGLDIAMGLSRAGGTVVSVSAHLQETWEFPLAAAFAAERTLTFVIGDSIGIRDALSSALVSGLLDPTFVVSRHDPLEAAADGYRAMRATQQSKVVLDL
jgi:threonine dehydrogenase-like Zn-dependent dehydrogenase